MINGMNNIVLNVIKKIVARLIFFQNHGFNSSDFSALFA